MNFIAGFQTPGSQILVYGLKILHTKGFFCKMPELHNFVILGLADTFHERAECIHKSTQGNWSHR